MAKKSITQDRLKELFNYSPSSGVFVRKSNMREMTGVNGCGYIQIKIDSHVYLGHRLAFIFMEGRLPTEIDHINRVRNDNRWSNLREVTRAENNLNRPLFKNNTHGITGVYWMKHKNKWYAKIGSKRLGYFDSFEDAVKARFKAESLLHPHIFSES